jgi:hypothetical protein
MYKVLNADAGKGTITFKLPKGSLEVSMKKDYRQVHPSLYVESTTGDIVSLSDAFRPFMYIEGILYTRANQFQFDHWNNIHHPDSDNALMYRLLMGIKN